MDLLCHINSIRPNIIEHFILTDAELRESHFVVGQIYTGHRITSYSNIDCHMLNIDVNYFTRLQTEEIDCCNYYLNKESIIKSQIIRKNLSLYKSTLLYKVQSRNSIQSPSRYY